MSTNKNWAGNVTFGASAFHAPRTIEQLQTIARQSRRFKPLGAAHCFNRIADTSGDQISMRQLGSVIALDTNKHTVTVEGGMLHGNLSIWLHERGYALHNLASLPHISTAGSCATATHGSGDNNGNLATAVAGLDLVRADGEIVSLVRGQHGFEGMVVGLGALGIVARMTLDVQPTFNVAQTIYEKLPFKTLEIHFDEITSAGYSVSLFTDWQGETINQVWVKRRVDTEASGNPANSFFGAKSAPEERHPLDGHSAINCTAQMGVAGPWHERLPHFRMDFTPSSGEELQAEYFVARKHALTAIDRIRSIEPLITPLLYISEIRTIASDNLWLSMCYQQDSVALHFTFKPDVPGVMALLPKIEHLLAPFNARPHWGKLFTMAPPVVHAQYVRHLEYVKLRDALDPDRKMRNEYLDALV